MSKSISSTVESLVRPILDENGFELVDVEFVKEGGNGYLRVIIDKPDGIDIDDCSKVSEFVSDKLDEHDPIPEAYFLEVTSPGVERPLKKPQDFYNAIGKNVYVTTYESLPGGKEFEGILTSYDEINLVIKAGKTTITIANNNVASARLSIVF